MFLSVSIACWHCFSEGTESRNCNKTLLNSPAEAWGQNVFYIERDHIIYPMLLEQQIFTVNMIIYDSTMHTEFSFTPGTPRDKVAHSSLYSAMLNMYPYLIQS